MNSYTGAEGAIEQSKPEILTGNEPVVAAQLIGEAMPGAAFAKPGRRGDSETILLVEDEAFVRKVTAQVLESAGYRLVIAGSAAEALDAYRKLRTRSISFLPTSSCPE